MIKGAAVKKLKLVPDERGRLMEILRCDDKIFSRFGQVYLTTAYPGVVKAWHYHKKQADNFTCIQGKIRLVLYDGRRNCATFKKIDEFILSLDNPRLIRIPPLVCHGFKCLSGEEALVINVPDLAYNRKKPDEYRIDPFKNDIPYDWKK